MDSREGLGGDIIRAVRLLVVAVVASLLLVTMVLLWAVGFRAHPFRTRQDPLTRSPDFREIQQEPFWHAPDFMLVSDRAKAEQIGYGRELVTQTSRYLGPAGTVLKISNGMNCQNCHLDAGTKIFGNNYSAVASTYPKFRSRSGTIESVEKRVNDCFERSLNGQPLDTASREMKAIVSYIQWVGSEVARGETIKGSGLLKLPTLSRAADSMRGGILYQESCATCHGSDGRGRKLADQTGFQFPPLWGDDSYNHGAGLYRLSTFAQFIYTNMPFGATYQNPVLTEEQAWDIAAYVNSLPRPGKDISQDWPDIRLKPFDHPFGPYADPFSEEQHKFGPFQPIKNFYEKEKP